jgi:glucose/arabinose dehydrogenase
MTLTGATLLLAACGGGGGGGGGDDACLAGVGIVRAYPNLSFDSPLSIQRAPGDTTHLYVAQQGGIIRVFDASDPAASTSSVFLDLTDRTRANGEQGLLGLAFDPDYATNGFVYVDYSANANPDVDAGDSVIARFDVPDRSARVADAASEVQLLRFDDEASNHNGGDLAFGPDGLLYISSGDGGGANDPNGNAQNLEDLRGKILRIAPRGTAAQIVPADNPFVGAAGRDEIWAYGLRNPFRMSFDGTRLWAGDVGQSHREEIDLIVKGGNYGWRKFEGTLDNFQNDPAIPNAIPPVYEYGRDVGTTVTGGRVYRGSAIPALVGRYLYGDFGSDTVWALAESGGIATDNVCIGGVTMPSSFGLDLDGEILITAYDGHLHRVVRSGSP